MHTKEHKIFLLNNLTVILTTHNSRYNFIFRALDNYEKEYGNYNLQIIISDSGDAKKSEKLQKDIIDKKYNLNIKFFKFTSHQNYESIKRDAYGEVVFEYSKRLQEAIKLIDTEFLVIAADDDFHFPNYFFESIDYLNNNNDYGCAYGHLLKFTLDKFVPYGKIVNFEISKDNNPPNPWLEDDNFKDRLTNLGKNPWSWFSWYAVQRTNILKKATEFAVKNKIDGYLFEKYLSFCNAVLYKTKKKNLIYAARQEVERYTNERSNFIPSLWEPFSYKRNKVQLENFVETCILFLKKYRELSYEESKNIVLKIVAKDFNEYKKNDNKEFFRFLKKNIRLIHYLQQKFFKPKIKTSIDTRLKSINEIMSISDEIGYIKNIVENNKIKIEQK